MRPLEFFFELGSDIRHLRFLRQIFPALAGLRGIVLSRSDIARLTLLLVEAFNNAHFHAHAKNKLKKVRIGIVFTPRTITLTLTDQGMGILYRKKGKAPVWASSGRGLKLMKALAEKISFRKTAEGHTLRIRYRHGKR